MLHLYLLSLIVLLIVLHLYLLSIIIFALVLHLDLYESLLLAMVICLTYEFGPKVIDIQEGYNKNINEDHWILKLDSLQ